MSGGATASLPGDMHVHVHVHDSTVVVLKTTHYRCSVGHYVPESLLFTLVGTIHATAGCCRQYDASVEPTSCSCNYYS